MPPIPLPHPLFPNHHPTPQTPYKPLTPPYPNPYQQTLYIQLSHHLPKIQTLLSNPIHPFYSGPKSIKPQRLKAPSPLF
ncbi:polymorphic toxin-type HINT domain-containing protein, partial [Neisseria sicca]|uniref:polymorphic toxin-type HINT domain-containing protein n=1 Tax=Neisseria sicca TaxID=490 RepID=UPI0034D97269